MKSYCPDKIIVDRSIQNEPFVQEILQCFSHVEFRMVEKYEWHKDELVPDPAKNPLTQGKKILHLKNFPGIAIKPCPGTTRSALCCNYLTIDFIENCSFECTYCILQAFLNKPVVTVHANLNKILADVKTYVMARPHRLLRVGTGEYSDSLAFDPILKINKKVIPFFATLPNTILELKTKSDYVDHLLDLEHGGQTVIGWSINPEYIVNREEFKTARLHERLFAAQKAVQAGYPVAFHLDPMIWHQGWEKNYSKLIEQVFDAVPPEKIAWFSLGTLRCLPKLKAVVDERFPKSEIFLGEFVQAQDGKQRYLKSIRQKMYSLAQRQIYKLAPKMNVYLCMEKPAVWNQSMPFLPSNDDALEMQINQEIQQVDAPSHRSCSAFV